MEDNNLRVQQKVFSHQQGELKQMENLMTKVRTDREIPLLHNIPVIIILLNSSLDYAGNQYAGTRDAQSYQSN